MELTPNVPGRLEALYHLQVFSVIILPGDKLETKLPQIHLNFFLASESHIGFGPSHKIFTFLSTNILSFGNRENHFHFCMNE